MKGRWKVGSPIVVHRISLGYAREDGLSYTEGFRVLLTDHPYPPSLMLRRASAEAISHAYGILEEVCLYNFERIIKKHIRDINQFWHNLYKQKEEKCL